MKSNTKNSSWAGDGALQELVNSFTKDKLDEQ